MRKRRRLILLEDESEDENDSGDEYAPSKQYKTFFVINFNIFTNYVLHKLLF